MAVLQMPYTSQRYHSPHRGARNSLQNLGSNPLAGFNNPTRYLFDWEEAERGELVVRYALPYSHLESLPEAKRQIIATHGWPLEWSHSLNDQVGGQLDAGFMLTGLYEDRATDELLGQFMPTYIATRAVKP